MALMRRRIAQAAITPTTAINLIKYLSVQNAVTQNDNATARIPCPTTSTSANQRSTFQPIRKFQYKAFLDRKDNNTPTLTEIKAATATMRQSADMRFIQRKIANRVLTVSKLF